MAHRVLPDLKATAAPYRDSIGDIQIPELTLAKVG